MLSTLQSWVYRRRRQVSAVSEPPVRLLPVQVSGTPAPYAATLEVVLLRGVRVRVPPGADIDAVVRLVAALERGAC